MKYLEVLYPEMHLEKYISKAINKHDTIFNNYQCFAKSYFQSNPIIDLKRSHLMSNMYFFDSYLWLTQPQKKVKIKWAWWLHGIPYQFIHIKW